MDSDVPDKGRTESRLTAWVFVLYFLWLCGFTNLMGQYARINPLHDWITSSLFLIALLLPIANMVALRTERPYPRFAFQLHFIATSAAAIATSFAAAAMFDMENIGKLVMIGAIWSLGIAGVIALAPAAIAALFLFQLCKLGERWGQRSQGANWYWLPPLLVALSVMALVGHHMAHQWTTAHPAYINLS